MVMKKLLQLWPESLLTQALVVGTVVGVAAYLLLKKRYKLPPGPRGWPLVGNMLALSRENGGLYFRTLEVWSRKYGPVMTVSLAGERVVVLSSIEAVNEALLKRQADFAGRPKSYTTSTFSDGQKNIMFADYGPTWKLHRKLVSKALRHYLSGDNLSKKISECLRLMTGLMRQEAGAFETLSYLSFAVFNIIFGMCFNKIRKDFSDRRFKVFIGELDTLLETTGEFFLEDSFPPFRLFPTRHFRKFLAMKHSFHAAIDEELEEHRKSFSPDDIRDLTDAILLAQKEAKQEENPRLLAQITDTHIRQTISDLLFAGMNTSRQTLNWVLLVMAQYPEVQKKVQEEVDQVIGPDLAVDVNDRHLLPYTDAVVHETMRLQTAAPTGVLHMTLCDTSVGGYEIPKGTTVMINHYALLRDPDQWGDASTFRPERFLDASGKMFAKPESWLPFSAGRRVCLGETVAKPELHLIVAGIMRAFTVSLAPGETHDLEPRSKGFVNNPGNYKIVVSSRI